MVAVDALGYAVLAGILFGIGGLVGWLSGWLLSRCFYVRWTPMVDVLSGALGFIVGTYVSFARFSYHAEWYEGRLVSRQVGGLADHFVMIGIVSSVAVVVIVKAIAYIYRKTT